MAGSSTTKDGVLSLTVTDADAPVRTPKKTKKTKAKKVVTKSKTKPKASKKSASKKTSSKKKVATKNTVKPNEKSEVDLHTTTKKTGKKEVLRSIKRQPLGHLLFEQKLREAGFGGIVSTDDVMLDTYSTDESIFSIRPQVVLQPKNRTDVETAVKVVAKETSRFPALSLTPRAAGTGLSGGSLTDSVVIDVSTYLKRIDEPMVEGGQVTITCEPGAMWRDVEKKLKDLQVEIPSAPASKDLCTVVGAVSNNAAGPDSLRYGHTAEWIESLDVTLQDGVTYTLKPLTYKEFKALIKKKNAYANIAKKIFSLIEDNEKLIATSRPSTKKNTAGYAIWDVLSHSVAEFKKGKGTFDLTRLIAGGQGTIGIIVSVTMKTNPIEHNTTLISIPLFDLECAGRAILEALKYDPVNIEIFDAETFELALQNPNFFKSRLVGIEYYRAMLSMYTMYHVYYRKKTPKFTVLITLDNETVRQMSPREIVINLQKCGCNVVRFVKSPAEAEMLWQMRRASYSLSKLQDPKKRPAAFLEDMTVPPQNLFRFFSDIQKLLKKYNVKATVHGHGGNGHFHFYPLLDFTNKTTPALIMKMAEEFFDVAIKHNGSLCGEHNDGIIRTPHLSKMFSKRSLELFEKIENIFDPDDIFNPGKKVRPRFDIKDSIRNTN